MYPYASIAQTKLDVARTHRTLGGDSAASYVSGVLANRGARVGKHADCGGSIYEPAIRQMENDWLRFFSAKQEKGKHT